ncbi:MAG TPA: YdeI/OmpD-associated family protein, partial [Flavisolibacter sp.]|nr:YdeI/OmpD-associated family protein [Flavisolibacter sp.]
MIHFKTTIKKFEKQGEKTGWTYISITQEQAERLKPATKVSFRVKGLLDDHGIEKTALLPMGDGSFIMPLNAAMRKALKKGKGDNVNVQLELDAEPVQHDADFLECLHDEPAALQTFQQLARGHQNYFSNWIQSAKTAP